LHRLILFSLLYLCAVVEIAAASPFRFTAIPDQNSARLAERFDKVAAYLSAELRVNVEYVPVKSYGASVAAFKNDQVQLAWFGGLSGVQARRAVPDSRAIAQGEEDLRFTSYFIARVQTGIVSGGEFPANIAGRTFTFGSKGSTSGRLMPEYFIRQHLQQAPDKVFRRVGFSGDHSKTLALVQSGAYEVGALNFKVWESELAAGHVDTSKVQVIWQTPVYPDYNWTIRGDVDGKFGVGFADKVQAALLAMKDPDLLASFPRSRFIPADNDLYAPILKTAIAIGLIEE
jgi:phosphonate transport system substrate-binding protein